jgi:hypothetical protein
MSVKQLNVRIDGAIRDRVKATAEAEGISQPKLVERALADYFAASASKTLASDSEGDSNLLARLEALEAQVVELAAKVGAATATGQAKTAPPPQTKDAPKQPPQNRQQAASKPPQVSGLPPESPRRADGQRWLTTSQAVEVSRARGGPDNVATLKRWGKDGELGAIGLRFCPHGTKRNDLASFEDLRWEG